MDSLEKKMFAHERVKIATQIKEARKSERKNDKESYSIEKSGKECLYRLGGLKCLFEYLRTLPSNKILDVGVGAGHGSSVLSKMNISKGLDFEVTALRNIPELQKNFPREKIHITGVETLNGIQNESLAGVIGVNSIGYSDHPALAAKKIDQVLITGGVIKATFYSHEGSEKHHGTSFKGPTAFIGAFNALGYDVSYINDNLSFGTGKHAILSNSLVIAVKPGNEHAPRARELLNYDLDIIRSEAIMILPNGIPKFDTKD